MARSIDLEKLKPFGDRILVRACGREETTESGLYIPQTADPDPLERFDVLAVGPGRWSERGDLVPMRIKTGQRVLLFAGRRHLVESGVFLVGEDQVVAVEEA
jgi:chaperonin GroES